MSDLIREPDIDLGPIRASRVGVIGYGNQGRAQAQNLRDFGIEVRVGLRDGSPRRALAAEDGLVVDDPAAVSAWADLLMLAVPDAAMGEVFTGSVRPGLRPGDAVLLCHGFGLRYGLIDPVPGVDFGLVAPKGAGHWLRARFVEGSGLAALVAVAQDASGSAWPKVLGYACAIGCGRVGLLRTTVAEETETDLFGEQAVLCGGIPYLLKTAYRLLIERGHQPEVAYFECVQEAKLIVDLIVEKGMAGMRAAISETAAYGGLEAEERLASAGVAPAFQALLSEIEDGTFAQDYLADRTAGHPRLHALTEREAGDPIAQGYERFTQTFS